MDKRTIIFRADGGATIGMGHFIRSLALAEMLKDEFYCIFAIQVPSLYQKAEIAKVCNELYELPASDSHFDLFLDLLQGNEIVVLDNYYYTTEYQQLIKNKGCKLVCIDDMHDKHYVADIVVNHAEGVDKNLYSIEAYTQLCLGSNYALLKKEYLQAAVESVQKKYSYFLMMGGADPFNLTFKILSMLEPEKQQLPVVVIVGAGFKDDALFNSFLNIKFYKGIDSSKIFELMQQSRLGILPASTVAIEACASRLPYICGFFIDNQKEMYNSININKLAICVGHYSNITKNILLDAINRIFIDDTIEKIIETQKLMLDKKSPQRFVQLFKNI